MSGLVRPLLTRGGSGPDPVARGVWRVRGEPGRMNVYLLDDGSEGLVMFDAGGRSMVDQLRSAVGALGRPLRGIVLGHAHTDHRGAAPALGVPVRCHADEVIDAEGSGGWRYWPADLAGLSFLPRIAHREILHRRFWDGGPVRIAGTVAEGEDVCGFTVVHLPGHAPGQIALLRETDGVALTTDAFYVVDDLGHDCPPRLPGATYNLDTDAARASLRRLADLPISVAWAGHGRPLRGDVRRALLAAADRSR